MKTNLKQYGPQELDMVVMNDEYLYNTFLRAVRNNDIDSFIEELKEDYIFDEDQEEELRASFISERTEENN